MVRDQRIHADIRPDQTGVDVNGLRQNQSLRLTLLHDAREYSTKGLCTPALADARQRRVIRQCLVQGIADEPADREIDLRLPHQSPVMNDAEEKTCKHQAHGDFGINAGAARVSAIEARHF
jgi:hypothetical protein